MRLRARKASVYPRVEPVVPAAPSEPDEGVARAAATNDGAQVPHLVGYRSRACRPFRTRCTRALGGGRLEGKDLPKGTRRGVALQPESVQAFLTFFGPKCSVSSRERACAGAR